jgi:hypothetical protein
MKKILLFITILTLNAFDPNARFKEIRDCTEGKTHQICKFYKLNQDFFVNAVQIFLKQPKLLGKVILDLEQKISVRNNKDDIKKLSICFEIIKHFS